jgi:cytochrome P450
VRVDWDFGPRRKITFPLFGDGIFTQEGPAWKHSRELLRPQFTYKQYEDLEVFRQHVDNLLEVIATDESRIVDLQPLFFRLTLDTTTAFLFGESVYSLKSGGIEGNFEESFNTAQSYVAMRFRLLDLYWLIGGKTFNNACKSIHQFADEILDRGLHSTRDDEEADNRYIFLDALARDYPDRTALRQQMMNILLAGRDTTACLLSWTLYETSTLDVKTIR